MGLVVGVDEAGYGPNLGPLVISATVWELPGDAAEFDLWQALRPVVSNRPERATKRALATSTAGRAVAVKRCAQRLHVADSKQVYSTGRGLGPLETSVLSLLGCHAAFSTLRDLWRHVHGSIPAEDCSEAWFGGEGLALPVPLVVADERQIAGHVDRLQQQFDEAGIGLRCIASDIVLTERFNSMTNSLGSKGATLSRTTLELVRRVWNPNRDGPALIVADKHGGRSRYQGLLAEVFETLPLCVDERPECSRYRIGETEVRFEARAERHLPVAVASMVSKYVRELSMEAFNRFWRGHLPDLAPTKGYPTDARRFRQQIAEKQAQLGIPDTALWRER